MALDPEVADRMAQAIAINGSNVYGDETPQERSSREARLLDRHNIDPRVRPLPAAGYYQRRATPALKVPEIETLFQADFAKAKNGLERRLAKYAPGLGLSMLPQPAQMALIDMAFNRGPGGVGRRLMSNLASGNWDAITEGQLRAPERGRTTWRVEEMADAKKLYWRDLKVVATPKAYRSVDISVLKFPWSTEGR
jgi:hypothetical protein